MLRYFDGGVCRVAGRVRIFLGRMPDRSRPVFRREYLRETRTSRGVFVVRNYPGRYETFRGTIMHVLVNHFRTSGAVSVYVLPVKYVISTRSTGRSPLFRTSVSRTEIASSVKNENVGERGTENVRRTINNVPVGTRSRFTRRITGVVHRRNTIRAYVYVGKERDSDDP